MNKIDVAQVEQVLTTTRSVRRKLDYSRDIAPQDLEACINAAVQAPTGLAGENWRFLVVTDADKKRQVAKIYAKVLQQISRDRDVELKATHHAMMARLHEIPCMVFVFAVGEPTPEVSGQLAFYGSILPAAWSLMLAMRARGIGTTWTTLLSSRTDEIRQILGVPEGVTQTVMLPAAYTLDAKLKQADRLPAAEVTYWNEWGSKRPGATGI
ncbi:MAG: nitroreductase family protein [Pseudomonadales bacterium]